MKEFVVRPSDEGDVLARVITHKIQVNEGLKRARQILGKRVRCMTQ